LIETITNKVWAIKVSKLLGTDFGFSYERAKHAQRLIKRIVEQEILCQLSGKLDLITNKLIAA
jgi:hypothetical protein